MSYLSQKSVAVIYLRSYLLEDNGSNVLFLFLDRSMEIRREECRCESRGQKRTSTKFSGLMEEMKLEVERHGCIFLVL
jgi:hypothetical protein